jgi:hypothetical protein
MGYVQIPAASTRCWNSRRYYSFIGILSCHIFYKKEIKTGWIFERGTPSVSQTEDVLVVWTSLGPLPRWVPGPTTRWAPGTTRLALHGT